MPLPIPCRAARRASLPLLLVLAVALAACSPASLLNATIPEQGLAIERGVAYGPLPRQRLDLYRATDAATPLPLVVFFYGGGWDDGERGDYLFVAEGLARAGFLVAVPDYRLYPEVRFPAFLEDAAKAVAYLQAAAPEHGGDGERLALMGHSAGAWIAAFLALDPRWLAAEGTGPAAVSAVVGLAGPYAFDPLAYDSTREIFSVGLPSDALRPIAYVSESAPTPPFLLLHGEDDETVYRWNSERLAAALRAAGHRAELRTYPGLAHIGLVLALAEGFRGRAPVLADTLDFLRATLGP